MKIIIIPASRNKKTTPSRVMSKEVECQAKKNWDKKHPEPVGMRGWRSTDKKEKSPGPPAVICA